MTGHHVTDSAGEAMEGMSGRRIGSRTSISSDRATSLHQSSSRSLRVIVFLLAFAALVAGVSGAAAGLTTTAASTAGSGVAAGNYGHLIAISQLVQRPPAPTSVPRAVPQHAGGIPTGPGATTPRSWLVGGPGPSLHESFEGVFDPGITPPDTNGAAGPTRQVEIVNQMLGIWDQDSPPTLLAQMSLAALSGSSGFLIDPRLIWDAQTRRFYYSMGDDTNDAILVGFSTTADPSSSSDWCRYAIPQANLVDQPHLGDSQDFLLIGFFLFFNGPQVAWYAKPPAGPTCPATLASGMEPMPSAGGYPPAPAHEIDATPTGYVLAAQSAASTGELVLERVTKDAAGNAVFSRPSSVGIPAFNAAPPAPQQGASQLIGLDDPRLNQVVGAVDPLHQGRFALWTDQTVAGGAGSEIRWFEIDAASNTLFQSGTVASPTWWAFDGAISPDRLVNGAVRRFGGSMVLTFNTSSTASEPAIWIISKRGPAPQSTPLLVHQSPAPYISFECASEGSVCRWGDYSGAAPDPITSATGARGVVWGAAEWNVANPNPTGATAWRTWVFTASP